MRAGLHTELQDFVAPRLRSTRRLWGWKSRVTLVLRIYYVCERVVWDILRSILSTIFELGRKKRSPVKLQRDHTIEG